MKMKKGFSILAVLFALVAISTYHSFHNVAKWTVYQLLFENDVISQLFLDDNIRSAATTDIVSSRARANLINELESFNHTYYIYSDSNISQDKPSWIRPVYHGRYGHEDASERIILSFLRNHSLRTENPDDAELYIVPTPVAKIITSGGLSYDEAFSALLAHPIFQKFQGNRHIILSLAHVTYNYENRHNIMALSKWLPSLVNVTAALSSDQAAAYAMYERGELVGNDYAYPFSMMKPLVHHSFSVGLGVADQVLPITPASLNKFKHSTYFIFYHTRTQPSMFNATRFRHAPVLNVSLSALPNSSIGFDIPKEEWLSRMRDSKFCLAIRGDSPHSHALLRSVRAGCIPVVISDLWPEYSPTLKSSLRIEDYSIMIKEADFIQDPQNELLKLSYLNMSLIEEKIANLSVAQRVLQPDHPNSLFVPAFLKEAMHAMENPAKVHY